MPISDAPAPVIVLRPATMADARHLFEWRNDPETRTASLCTERIPWSVHLTWLSDVLDDRHRDLFVAQLPRRIPVGSVRFDHRSTDWTISWVVAPLHRGKGIGRSIVSKAVQRAAGHELRAIIRPDNRASIAIAVAAGFNAAGTVDEFTVWRRPAGGPNQPESRLT
jgi:RimJ/RimL family protein N-acetyltransferase